MEQQRPLRLGDLVDDYCPRERRVTNHAIVALVEDTIRQTRCTTCESDHVYKGGKAPVRKKKDEKAVLYDQVLANVTAGQVVAPPPEAPAPVAVVAAPPAPTPTPKPAPVAAAPPVAPPVVPLAAVPAVSDKAPAPTTPPVDEVWSLHRPLIRASLPRNDSQPPTPRAIPEFTMHQRNVRGSQHFRGGGQSNGNGNGNGGGGGYRGGFRADGPSADRGQERSFDRGQDRGPDRSQDRGERGPDRGASQGQGQPQGQPGPNGQRPGGGRRRRRHKKPKPQI
jgi:hypothetical protein